MGNNGLSIIRECKMSSIAELVEQEVSSWPNVVKLPHRFGGIEFRVNGHEIGHLHGSRQADLPFSLRTREELVAAGRGSLPTILPPTGGGDYYLFCTGKSPCLILFFFFKFLSTFRTIPPL